MRVPTATLRRIAQPGKGLSLFDLLTCFQTATDLWVEMPVEGKEGIPIWRFMTQDDNAPLARAAAAVLYAVNRRGNRGKHLRSRSAKDIYPQMHRAAVGGLPRPGLKGRTSVDQPRLAVVS